MTRATVLTGGNAGDTASILERARELLGLYAGTIVRCSSVRRTKAWGFAGDDFLNQAAMLDTELSAEELLDAVQRIERELGRDRGREREEKTRTGERYASRPIDIDILFYGDEVIATGRLTIPHPRIAERSFVLEPLAEIAGGLRHPATGRTVEEMLNDLRRNERL